MVQPALLVAATSSPALVRHLLLAKANHLACSKLGESCLVLLLCGSAGDANSRLEAIKFVCDGYKDLLAMADAKHQVRSALAELVLTVLLLVTFDACDFSWQT